MIHICDFYHLYIYILKPNASITVARLGESQPGDLQGQLHAALAYIKKLETEHVAAGVPSGPAELKRATPLQVPGTIILQRFFEYGNFKSYMIYEYLQTGLIYIYTCDGMIYLIYICMHVYIYIIHINIYVVNIVVHIFPQTTIQAEEGSNATLPATIPGDIEPAAAPTLEIPATQPEPEEQFQDAQSDHEMDLAETPKSNACMEPSEVPKKADVPEPMDVENVDKVASWTGRTVWLPL